MFNIHEELVFNVNDVNPPEYTNNGFFDAGELVSEHLLLEIDPFETLKKLQAKEK